MTEFDDKDIIEALKAGSQTAMEMLFDRYKSRILNFSLRYLGNRADAEDVTSDVFVTLFSNKYTWNPTAKLSTWLFTVARNACLTRLRKKKNIISIWFTKNEDDDDKADVWDIPDENSIGDQIMSTKESIQHVKKAISKLPVEQREAIILREYQRLSYEEIAQILECSLDKVKVLIFRARENLRAELLSFMKEGQND